MDQATNFCLGNIRLHGNLAIVFTSLAQVMKIVIFEVIVKEFFYHLEEKELNENKK